MIDFLGGVVLCLVASWSVGSIIHDAINKPRKRINQLEDRINQLESETEEIDIRLSEMEY